MRLVLLPLIVLATCAASPTAPPVEDMQETVAPAVEPSPVAPSPTPTPAGITAEWKPLLHVEVTNGLESPAWIEVEWSWQMPDGRWWTYWRESAVIRAGGTHHFHPDCVFTGLGEVSVVHHGLWHRQKWTDVSLCY